MAGIRDIDPWARTSDNIAMSIETAANSVHELQETLTRAASGVRDRVEMREAREEMNRLREELKRKIGVVDIAVELIRDARNQ